jgi:hypothetical protein
LFLEQARKPIHRQPRFRVAELAQADAGAGEDSPGRAPEFLHERRNGGKWADADVTSGALRERGRWRSSMCARRLHHGQADFNATIMQRGRKCKTVAYCPLLDCAPVPSRPKLAIATTAARLQASANP